MPRIGMSQRTLAPRWLNTLEAATYLGLSPKALRERCFMRKLPYSKLNGSLRFDKAELDAMLERSRVKPIGDYID